MSVTPTDSANHRRLYLTLGVPLLASALAAAATLIWLAQETGNDANSWLVWAGQLAQGHAIDFGVGPSWKPLPVLVSIPVELLSPTLAGYLWLWFVRFCLLATSVLLFDLTSKEWGPLGGAVAATLPLTITPWVTSGIAGMSEPVLISACLAAVWCGRNGKPRSALGFVIAAGLVRPEVWAFLILWLVWRHLVGREDLPPIIRDGVGAFSIWLLLWFAIPAAAGGTALQASDRASETIGLGQSGMGLLGQWLRVIPPKAWILIPIGLAAGVLLRNTSRGRFALLASAAGALWLVETAVLNLIGTEPGLSRYAIPAGIALCALAGCGAGWLLELSSRSATGELRLRPYMLVAVGLLVGWSLMGSSRVARSSWDNAIAFQASSDSELAALKEAGGLNALAGCLPFTTAGYPGHARILARRLNRPLQAFTAAPTDSTRAIVLTSINPGVRAIAQMPAGAGVPLATAGAWTVTYYGPKLGCTPN